MHKQLAIAFFTLILFLVAGAEDLGAQADFQKARNVIFVIGDGMGLGQAAYLVYSSDTPVSLERFPVIGLQKTHSANQLITDSGAAATAFSCGHKTFNSAVGIGADSVPCTDLFELARQQGKRTGVVVTSSVVHATPAAFVAHEKLRGFYEEIAADIVTADLDYLVGGGQMYFRNRYIDDQDLIKEMKDEGVTVSGFDRQPFRTFARKTDPRMVYFTAASEPMPKTEGRLDLSVIVSHAFKVLDRPGDSGFFLMIEGSQIDFACHANNSEYLLSELRDLDGALDVVLAYAMQHDDTLVIVTGDHECGEVSFRDSKPGRRPHVEFGSRNHSPTMVPVYALGPGASEFNGIYDNTEIFQKVKSIAGY